MRVLKASPRILGSSEGLSRKHASVFVSHVCKVEVDPRKGSNMMNAENKGALTSCRALLQ